MPQIRAGIGGKVGAFTFVLYLGHVGSLLLDSCADIPIAAAVRWTEGLERLAFIAAVARVTTHL